MVLTPAMTHALDLGKLHVRSSLTLPLDAEIELIALRPQELDTLVTRVIFPTNFPGSSESQPLLSDIKVTIAKRSDESYFLQLRSPQPLTEPFLQFGLEATWAGGRLVREFTALIDPPRLVQTAEDEEHRAADKTATLSAKPRHSVAASSEPERVVPVPIQTHGAIGIARLGKASVQPQAISGASVVMSSDKAGEPAAAATTHTLASIGEPTVAGPRHKPSAEVPVPARQFAADAVQQSEPAAPPPTSRSVRQAAAQAATNTSRPAASPPADGRQDVTSAVAQRVPPNPTWALMLVGGLAAALLLLAVGLTVFIIKLHRRHAQHGLEQKLPVPKLVTPENTHQPRAPGEGNGRWQDRRQRIDRRQRSVPVAIERRSGLARRRSELADGGVTTVCVEVSDPIAEAEAYLAGGFYEHAEQALEDAITKDPSRLDLKVKLLEVYKHTGNEPALRILADELRPELGRRRSERPHDGGTHGRGANGDETVLRNDLPMPGGFESAAPAPAPARQSSTDDHSRPAAVAQDVIEWQTVEGVATPTRDERETEALSPQCAATPTITLQEAFRDFLHAKKTLKPSTVEGYKRVMTTALADWRERALLEISADMVSKRHAELSQDRGEVYANRSMRFLRTLYNFALERHRNGSDTPSPENPVQCL